ncbi:hypothetical protein [Chamaesiphon sp. VAR_48_metabat_135_sub]|uniref:hypothetical protein n=1 Tax=Chamaesiphon sp. VAR_48_metabat_135_sub TaxID=2964699 RepID=UPI00286B06BB|nr:hypothetical protein [Chamaesiphon sp. VAR_48_metabat_135_sub]
MNTQLVDSIVQLVETLPPAERDLVKHKLLLPQALAERQTSSSELTLAERRAFLRQPLAERRSILAQQAEEMLTHYQSSTEWRELMAGDIIDD